MVHQYFRWRLGTVLLASYLSPPATVLAICSWNSFSTRFTSTSFVYTSELFGQTFFAIQTRQDTISFNKIENFSHGLVVVVSRPTDT